MTITLHVRTIVDEIERECRESIALAEAEDYNARHGLGQCKTEGCDNLTSDVYCARCEEELNGELVGIPLPWLLFWFVFWAIVFAPTCLHAVRHLLRAL